MPNYFPTLQAGKLGVFVLDDLTFPSVPDGENCTIIPIQTKETSRVGRKMTEYDYSEEAYHRHLETQARISQWAHTTGRVPQADPFVPATPATSEAPLRKEKDGRRRTRSERRRHRDRSPPPPLPLVPGGPKMERSRSGGPPRPRTAPPKGDVYGLQQPPFYHPVQAVYPQPYPPTYTYFSPPPPMSAPPPQHQHRRTHSSPQAPGPPMSAPPPWQPHPHTHTRSYSFGLPPSFGPMPVPPPPVPARTNSYPYPPTHAPPPGQNWFATPPPPGYASAPHLPSSPLSPPPPPQSPPPGPSRARSPVPAKETSWLKRMFGRRNRR
ncbi:hypothetical protein GGX14DRAFT_700841 [Mycena pura]|uniref:Uncharacterized protein n=1 Tax=Mycena pura TaxID=153505 RepID=A0AAD6UY41_9AGAR|nr:hypothetical protein GGX14DRAFT_700841 [Mycena pura]